MKNNQNCSEKYEYKTYFYNIIAMTIREKLTRMRKVSEIDEGHFVKILKNPELF